MKMSVNGVSWIIGVESWVIYVSQHGNNSKRELCQRFQLKQRTTPTLLHYETERQCSINKILSLISGNQGFVRIGAFITERLTASITKNVMDRVQKAYSKMINVSESKSSKKGLLAVEYLIMIMYNYLTGKIGTLYKSTDGPAGRPADNPHNLDGLGDLHRTCAELKGRVH